MESNPYLHTEADAEDDAPFVPLTTMVNFFLEDIVQPNYLTDLELRLGKDFANTTQLEESFWNETSQWEIYTVGFILFLTLGVVVAIVLFVLGPIIMFCLIKDIGPCRRVCSVRPSTISKWSWLAFGITVGVLTLLMLLVVISMLVMLTWIRYRCDVTVFEKCTDAVKVMSAFLADTADELQNMTIQTIDNAENTASGLLDAIPYRASLAFDLTMENHTSKNVKRLQELGTQELPKLQANLEDVMSMINATEIPERVEGSSSQNSIAQRPEMAQKLETLLNVVKMATTNDSENVAGSKPLAQQMSEAGAPLQAMKDNMAKSVNDPLADIKSEMTNKENTFKEFVATAKSLSLTFIISRLETFHNSASPIINIAYSVFFILIIVLLVITVLYATAFLLYMPYWLSTYQFSGRDRRIQSGRTLFRVVVYSILLTAWLYWLIAALFMYFAGMAHTEVCRHLLHPHGIRSRRVVRILDALITSKLFEDPRKSFSILETYVNCEKDEPVYKAGNVQALWKFDNMFNLSGLERATNRLQDINVMTPHANLQSSELKAVMLRLEDLRNKMDIAGMSQRLEASALPDASMLNTDTDRSQSLIQSQPNIHEHNKNLARKLSQIAYDMDSYDLGNLSRGLEENQNTFRKTGQEITKVVIRNTSTQVFSIFAGAVQQIEFAINNKIGHCRPIFVVLKSALAEPCIQILYPINGFWFCLGMANLLLILIFITSYKLSDFLEPSESEDKPPISNTTAVNPSQSMSEEKQNLDQPQATSKPPQSNRVSPKKK